MTHTSSINTKITTKHTIIKLIFINTTSVLAVLPYCLHMEVKRKLFISLQYTKVKLLFKSKQNLEFSQFSCCYLCVKCEYELKLIKPYKFSRGILYFKGLFITQTNINPLSLSVSKFYILSIIYIASSIGLFTQGEL